MFCSPEDIFKDLGIRRPTPKGRPEPARREAQAGPSRHPAEARRSIPAVHGRQEFTAEDRDFLARYLADACPDEKGRTSKRLYDHLVECAVQVSLCNLTTANGSAQQTRGSGLRATPRRVGGSTTGCTRGRRGVTARCSTT